MPPEPDHYQQRREQFALIRDFVLLAVGSTGLLATLAAVVFTDIHDPSTAALLVGAFGTMCGLPGWLRYDEKRARDKGQG